MNTPVARPTLRCLTEDLGFGLPSVEVQVQDATDHPLMEELVRLAPDAPTGQKRVLSIDHPMVYRVRHSRWRGATWLEEGCGVYWLCAAETREEGAADDAYEYFKQLHAAGRLLPNAQDYTRLKAERVARILSAAKADAPALVRSAQARMGNDLPFNLAGEVSGRLHASERDELWVAISRLPPGSQQWLTDRLVMLLFAIFKAAALASAEEQRFDWASGDLEYHEVARFFL